MDSVNAGKKVTRKYIPGCLPDRIVLDYVKSQEREEIFSPLTSSECTHPEGGSALEGRRAMQVGRRGCVWGVGGWGVGNRKLAGKIKD